MLTLLLAATGLAATLTSPDGAYTLNAPGYDTVGPARLVRGRDAYTVVVHGARAPGDLPVLDFLRGYAAQNDSGVQVYTWQGEAAGRQAACLDTRKSLTSLKVELRTWCGAALPDGRVAILVMETRDVVKARTYGAQTQRLLDGVAPTTVTTAPAPATPVADASLAQPVATPATTAPKPATGAAPSPRASSLSSGGFSCTEGVWNGGSTPDLQVWWNPSRRDAELRFRVVDGGGPVIWGLAGGLNPDNGVARGTVSRVEGPDTSTSGVHRLFSRMPVSLGMSGDLPASFQGPNDNASVKLSPCASLPSW